MTRDALCAMLEQLRANGIRDVHFLVHSLGASVVLRSICDDPDKRIARLFAECEVPGGGGDGGAAAASPPAPPTGRGSSGGPSGSPHQSESSAPPLQLLRLKTFTLLHPDCSLKRLVRHGCAALRRLYATLQH